MPTPIHFYCESDGLRYHVDFKMLVWGVNSPRATHIVHKDNARDLAAAMSTVGEEFKYGTEKEHSQFLIDREKM